MNHQHQNTAIEALECSGRIFTQVVMRIERSRTKRNRWHAALHGALTVGAVAGIIPAVTYLIQEATQSGFVQYASLVGSDGSYAVANWKELLWSMAESMPILETALVLAILLVLINSVHYVLQYIRAQNPGARIEVRRPHAVA